MLKDILPLGIKTALFGTNCTQNVYCSDVGESAIKLISQETGITEASVVANAHKFKPYEMPVDHKEPHPQAVYRRLVKQGRIRIGQHATANFGAFFARDFSKS